MPKLDNIKIIFIDIDGTLTNKAKEITEFTKNILKKTTNRGIYTVICSGRTNTYTIEKSKLAGCSNIVISDNGALIYDYLNQKSICDVVIEKEILKKIYEFSKKNDVGCAFNCVSKRYKTKNCDKNALVIESIDEIDETVTQVVLDTKVYEKVELVEEWIKATEVLEICNCSNSVVTREKNAKEYEFDVVLTGINKGVAIKTLLERLNIDKNDAICFGDHINDYSMFEACGYKVAMENGMLELKEKADFIAKSNNEDGLARFIEENIL